MGVIWHAVGVFWHILSRLEPCGCMKSHRLRACQARLSRMHLLALTGHNLALIGSVMA